MYEIYDLNPDAMSAEIAYRHSVRAGRPTNHIPPRGRWWRRRATRTR
jgi:hypothetical protein